MAGIPVVGARYSQELGTYYQGGLVGRIVHVAPRGLWQMLSTALPATLVPYLSPLPIHGHAPDIWKVLSWQVSILVVVGAVVWAKRYRDAALPIAAVYLFETLFWPEVNERRVILVLPILAVWYVLGAKTAGQAAWSWLQSRALPAAHRHGWTPRRATEVAWAGAVVIVAALTVVPLAAQLPRDYLVDLGQNTSQFAGSPYVQILSQLGRPSDVVETDYESSTALYTGHDTSNDAFLDTLSSCDTAVIRSALALDHAGYLLLGNINKPDVLDSPCLLQAASSSSWAVPLLHTSRDDASVFELVGPGTGHPDLKSLTAIATRRMVVAGPSVFWEWTWSAPRPISQVSVGQAGTGGETSAVALQVRGEKGAWRTVASVQSAVGAGRETAPYLLAAVPNGTMATGVRVMISGATSSPPTATTRTPPVDLVALGSPSST
jgi:hypothetical protein